MLIRLCLVAALWITVSLKGQNLILNGGFEAPGLTGFEGFQSLTNGSTFVPGWTVMDDGVGQQPFYGSRRMNDAVLNGSYGIVLNQGSGIRTTFRTEVGQFYEVGLWVRPDDCPGCVTPAPLRVTISSNAVELPIVSGWSFQTVQFHATNTIQSLQLENTASTPDFKRYSLDDVSVTKVPGALLGVRMVPVVTVEGVIGAKYQIQAANSLNAPLWQTLTNFTLSNSPTFYLDTNQESGFGTARQRLYRAIRVP